MGSAKQSSAVLHLDDFEDIGDLKDAEAGKLLKAILAYVSTGAMPDNLGIQAKTMFRYIRRHIDRDKAKYEETCRKRAEAGKQGGRPKKSDDEKQNKAKKANGFFEKQNNPDTDPEPDPDTDPDTDPDPDTEPEPVAPQSCAPGVCLDSGSGQDDMYHSKEKRIAFLETMCRLYKSGALTDPEDYRRFSEELRMLKGG